MCFQIALKPVALQPQVAEATFVLNDASQETDLVAEVLDRARHLSRVGGQTGPHHEVGALRLFSLLPVNSERVDGLAPTQDRLKGKLRAAGRLESLAIGVDQSRVGGQPVLPLHLSRSPLLAVCDGLQLPIQHTRGFQLGGQQGLQ